MRSFFKSFFASFLAIIVFSFLALVIVIRMVKGATEKATPQVAANTVLVVNLEQLYTENEQDNTVTAITEGGASFIPSLYDVLQLLRTAKNDKHITGLYIKAGNNLNGFAASEELRNAILDFKNSNKFVVAYGNSMSEKAYYVANVADKIYVNPVGDFSWQGMSANYIFLKGTLDKLDVQPQVFYAGKFKSATEPLRAYSMSEANKLQTREWLNELYGKLLSNTSATRQIDSLRLKQMANEMLIKTAEDAFTHKLIDGLKYDDEVKDELKEKIGLGKYEKINFMPLNDYFNATNHTNVSGDKIALIVAEGDIVDGEGTDKKIGGDSYRSLIRKARLDQTVKAIVLRINSGGGSGLASEIILRELKLAKEEKPVIVSFGDVAASGGYYIAASADSIFALPNTLTGSIGVFSIIPDLSKFFKNKLGVTFDGVSTSPYADMPSLSRPLADKEKQLMQELVDRFYYTFKQRVADGRRLDIEYIDSVAQGRVWTGQRAVELGLVDKIGGIDDAISAAAAKAGLSKYHVKIYPEVTGFFDKIFNNTQEPVITNNLLEKELGQENYKLYNYLKQIKAMAGSVQARIPFEVYVN